MNARQNFIATQPRIPAGFKLLATAPYDGLSLDLYGTHDADGYEVCAVALAGSTVDLQAVLGPKVCGDMTAWCERHLPSGPALRKASRDEFRIGVREFYKAMAAA